MENGDARTKLEAVIERKRELESQIDMARTSLYGLHDPSSLGPELADWRLRKESMLRKYANDRGEAMKKQGEDLRVIEGKIESLSAELQTFAEKKKMAQDRLAELTNELKALNLTLSIDELLCLQEKVADCQKNLDGLHQAISDQKAILNDDQDHGKTIMVLTEKREDILADIARGHQVEDDALKKVTEEIKTVNALRGKHDQAVAVASQTIAGLKRKISQTEMSLLQATENFKTACIVFLKLEIEKAGEDFVDLAEKLQSPFERVIALASLCEKLGKPVNVFGPYTYQMKIPAFSPDVCKPKLCKNNPGLLFDFASVNGQDGIIIETGRLAGLGLKLPL